MATDPETLKYRSEHNLCHRDGRPNVPGRKLCEHCLTNSNARSRKYKQRKMDANLCINCGAKTPELGSRLCEECCAKQSVNCHNAYIKRYANRKSTKTCVDCGNAAEDQKTMCSICLTKRSMRQANYKNQRELLGLCTQCGHNRPKGKGKRCSECIEKRNKWYQGSTTQQKDKARRDSHRMVVLEHYGGVCICCGESEQCFLAIDHIEDGTGNAHRKEINKWGSGFNKWLVDNNFPDGFRVLCHNCNHGRHLNGGICPHEERK